MGNGLTDGLLGFFAEAGSRPAATRFLLLRQKKPGKEKTTPAAGLSGRTHCAPEALRSDILPEVRRTPKACASCRAHALGVLRPAGGIRLATSRACGLGYVSN